jgi:hypothetical protein
MHNRTFLNFHQLRFASTQHFLKSPYLFSQLALTDAASLPQLQRAVHIFSIRFCWPRRIMLKTKLIKNTWMISAKPAAESPGATLKELGKQTGEALIKAL